MVGLSVIILTAGLLAVALWLSVGFDKKKYNIYAVYTREAVSGLTEESPVKFNGVQVGYVLRIELNPTDPQQVKVLLNIEEGTPITISTWATLISQGITGTTYIGLSASSSDLTPLGKIPKEPYPIIPAKPSLFGQLDAVVKAVGDNVNKVAVKINNIFDDDNAEHLKKILANLEAFTQVIKENDKQISQTLRNTNVLIKNLTKASNNIPALIDELKTSAVKFNSMAEALSEAGKKVGGAMDAGRITMDKLSQQTIPPAVSLLHRLNNIAANIEQVSAQLRQNPSVLVRGTTPPKPGPGE